MLPGPCHGSPQGSEMVGWNHTAAEGQGGDITPSEEAAEQNKGELTSTISTTPSGRTKMTWKCWFKRVMFYQVGCCCCPNSALFFLFLFRLVVLAGWLELHVHKAGGECVASVFAILRVRNPANAGHCLGHCSPAGVHCWVSWAWWCCSLLPSTVLFSSISFCLCIA